MSARSSSAAETEALGAALAAELEPGDIVLVAGDLGVVRARALGVSGPVTSPTFTIGARYHGSVPIAHLDLFRLGGDLGAEDPGLLEDYLTPDAIAFVEWPEGAAFALEGRRVRQVSLAHAGGDMRVVEIL